MFAGDGIVVFGAPLVAARIAGIFKGLESMLSRVDVLCPFQIHTYINKSDFVPRILSKASLQSKHGIPKVCHQLSSSCSQPET